MIHKHALTCLDSGLVGTTSKVTATLEIKTDFPWNDHYNSFAKCTLVIMIWLHCFQL